MKCLYRLCYPHKNGESVGETLDILIKQNYFRDKCNEIL